jgi:hypothetical protein
MELPLSMLIPRCTTLALAALLTACDARPTVVINEFMADNQQTVADGALGEYHDWIELHNIGDEPVILQGFYLTDDLGWPTQAPLAPQLSVPAGGFLLLWASKMAANDPTHLPFALSSEGEELGLFWTDPASGNIEQLDAISFNAQSADTSMARDEDGTGAWGFSQQPTPGASNR